jgi:hypothetical protein
MMTRMEPFSRGSGGRSGGTRKVALHAAVLFAALVVLVAVAPGVAHASVQSVSSGDAHTCALKADGTIQCWGSNVDNQVSGTPTSSDFVAVSAGNFHTCALKADGTIQCWGFDHSGQVSGTPTIKGFTAVSAGSFHTCGLKADGSIQCWGLDDHNQVSGTPTSSDFVAVSAGNRLTCGLRAAGTIVCWGSDFGGGVSGTPASSDFTAVSASDGHACGLKADGTIQCWGNISGTPTSSDFTAVSATFGDHACGLKADGIIQCWGLDNFNQVSGTPTSSDFAAVSAGGLHTCGLKADSTIQCWGSNQDGQLGAAPAAPSPAPPAAGRVGTVYSHTFISTGSPAASFAVSGGTLPPGLSLSPGGVLSGTPKAGGDYTFTVTASNGIFADATSKQFTISIISDTTAPTTGISLDPASPDGQNGWYVSIVHATVGAQDEAGGTGVAETRCVLDPATAPVSFDDLPSGCDYTESGADVSAAGQHTLYAASVDAQGNKEMPVVSKQFKIDKTAPSVSSCSVTPSKLSTSANNHKLVTIKATVKFTDNTGGSGDGGFTLLSVTSNQKDSGLAKDDVPNDIQGWTDTPDDTRGQLRAERYGGARTYTLTYQGKDLAGNTKNCSATVTVPKGG